MPFAPFVGVNHHYQSILFGGALLKDEKGDTFVWLFTQFLRCMFNKHPISIITDQDSAICNPVKRVFPHTCHRFCVWHIQKHMVEHLQYENLRYPTFNNGLREVVKSITVAEFVERWAKLYEKYELSEGSRNCAISTKRRAEEDEDFKSLNTMPSTDNMHAFVVKAGALFTATIYAKFMKEWNQARWTASVRHRSSHVEKCITRDLSFHYLTISTKWLNVLGRAKEHDDVLADINNFFDDVILRLDEKDTLKIFTLSQSKVASFVSGSNNAHVNITI
ncbi:protein FAR1-RELATED SEQUENCE 5-like [Impatiens glandulifera]|uniref:protein FAR1-RELATED SEQUENCE 5-like n=1 Tax=Impatiens glandulifera TaxID=253017 RepID=UPI001FB159BB|nr:protein FAR1-RELATED SEQUENCE 5-like [Impatiens glandulifera]